MRSIPPSSSATRATTATAFATTWQSEASNPSSRRDRTVRRQSNTIGKPTSGATSSSDASIASSNSGASPPDTRKPPELTFQCYASQQRNSGSKPSTRPRLIAVSEKSNIAEAIRYGFNHWDGLVRFLEDGRIEMDTNIVERTIRPIALNRKNSLFAGHDAGAANWACLASLIETAKLHGLDPQAYLADILTKLVNGWPVQKLDELLPWAWAEQNGASLAA